MYLALIDALDPLIYIHNVEFRLKMWKK